MSAPEELDLSNAAQAAADGDGLLLDLEGYEGPLHALLELARAQKVDLARISLAALCDQFLAFIDRARAARIELAADYLVIAAWLAFIKSRILMPKSLKPEGEPDEAAIAAALAHKLSRLEEARANAKRLEAMPQLGRDVFGFGQPRGLIVSTTPLWRDDLYDLMAAYGAQANRRLKKRRHAVKARKAYALGEARARLAGLLEELSDWRAIEAVAPAANTTPEAAGASLLASTFGAALELVKEGRLEARQGAAFAPLFVRRRGAPA